MTVEELDALEKLGNSALALSSLTAQATVNHQCRVAVPGLVAEIRRLRDALACIAAPLSPTVEDLWSGVETARKVLKEGNTEQVAAARRAAKNLGDGRRA